MGTYTIYHPGSITPHPQRNIFTNYESAYCTDLLVESLKNILIENNHSAQVIYIDRQKPKRPLLEEEIPWEMERRWHAETMYIESLNLSMSHCAKSLWFILANEETKKFVIFDLQDSPGIAYRIIDHKNLIFAFAGQYSYERLRRESSESPNIYKFLPFIYTAYYPVLTKNLREEIQEIRNSTTILDDRIFFYGNNRDSYIHADEDGNSQKIREVISVLAEKYPDESCVGSWESKLPLNEFFKKAATHTINLALPGHPWCSREHELWTLGLPVMMYEHTHHMAVPLLPNYHYVAVPGGPRMSIGMAKDPELAADRIIETHREWIKPENRWRLNMVAKNGQDRIDDYANHDKIWNTVLPLLKLGHW